MELTNLIHTFDREIEVLDISADHMIYAIDDKDETKNRCLLESYDFGTGSRTVLLALDYTRIYESFQTYAQNDCFFYAVNVLQDYRVRLRKIDKRSWEIHEDILLEPEGEVLSLYILDDKHLLVTDEALSGEKYVQDYGMEDHGGRFMNLCYIYDIGSGRKYPVKDTRFHHLPETVKTYRGPQKCVTAIIPGNKDIYLTDTEAFIEAVKSEKPLPLQMVLNAEKDECLYYAGDADGGFYSRLNNGKKERILKLGFDGSSQTVCEYTYDNEGDYFYHLDGGHIYYCSAADEKNRKHLACMMDCMISFTFDDMYGDFTGICTDDMFVTTFYKEVQVKEDTEFHEYAAVHYRDGRETETYQGRCVLGGGRIILLKSFLAL